MKHHKFLIFHSPKEKTEEKLFALFHEKQQKKRKLFKTFYFFPSLDSNKKECDDDDNDNVNEEEDVESNLESSFSSLCKNECQMFHVSFMLSHTALDGNLTRDSRCI